MILKDKTYKHPYINKYVNGDKCCFVIRCTNPYIYTNPGYYITCDSKAVDKTIYNRCFKTSKKAAIAFFN